MQLGAVAAVAEAIQPQEAAEKVIAAGGASSLVLHQLVARVLAVATLAAVVARRPPLQLLAACGETEQGMLRR